MNVHETLKLELGRRSYEIQVGSGLLSSAGERIKPYLKQPRVIIITDKNVANIHLRVLKDSLFAADISSDEIVLPAGEQTKDFDYLKRLVDQILELRIERNSTLVALGGGVIGDLTGFAAAILLRGIEFIQIPTTLLAQIDSSIGGKTGINTPHGKNLVGAFYQPKLVLIDVDSLDTLPKREMLAGYAEIVKYGLINNAAFFEWLEEYGVALCDGNKKFRMHAIFVSCQTKSNIVSKDEFEQGDRALLNLGHTFGHALEAETGFSDVLLHGEAVAIGIGLACDLSSILGFCSHADVERVRTHYSSVGLPSSPSDVKGTKWDVRSLLMHMQSDKKVKNGNIRFVLVRGIGKAFVADRIEVENVRQTLERATSNEKTFRV